MSLQNPTRNTATAPQAPLAQAPLPPAKPVPWRPLAAVLAVTVIAVAAFWSVEITWSRLLGLPADIVRYLWLMFSNPNWDKLGEALAQTWRSVQMAWVGTVLGLLISFPLSFLAARGFAPAPVRGFLRMGFALIRAVPEIVIAIIILSVTGLTPLTGALALAVNSIGTLGKWGYESIEGVDPGPLEAVRAAGGSTSQVIRWGVWPSAMPEFVSFWLYRFEINVRASAVLGLIGVGGVGDMLTSYTQYREWSTVGVLILVVIAVTMGIDAVSGAIRRRLTDGGKPQ